jgi:hypothetical protein
VALRPLDESGNETALIDAVMLNSSTINRFNRVLLSVEKSNRIVIMIQIPFLGNYQKA